MVSYVLVVMRVLVLLIMACGVVVVVYCVIGVTGAAMTGGMRVGGDVDGDVVSNVGMWWRW